MRRIKFGFTILLMMLALLYACKKNQKTAQSLGGSWSAERITTPEGDVEMNDLPREVVFNNCAVDKINCTGKWVASDSSIFNFFYTITDKGSTLVWGGNESVESMETQAFRDMSRFGGNWKIERLEQNYLHISSAECSGFYEGFSMKMVKQKE